jgi:hypothetical protein
VSIQWGSVQRWGFTVPHQFYDSLDIHCKSRKVSLKPHGGKTRGISGPEPVSLLKLSVFLLNSVSDFQAFVEVFAFLKNPNAPGFVGS